MRIFFSVGEPSGDVHGANLVRELRTRDGNVQCVGYGGPRMRTAGCELHEDLTKFAVMWFLHVLLNIHHFWRLYKQAGHYFRDHRPDAVVLIDYPGFNWWIARAAKRHDIPVFYYGVPQIWAWAGWRIKKMRRLVSHALCKLPFEEDWYRQHGCNAKYVGHPFFDETTNYQFDQEFLDEQRQLAGRLVTILPGSRTQEVKNNLRWFIKAVEHVHAKIPDARFAIAAFNDKQAALAHEILGDCQLPIDVHTAKTPELIHLAECCMACSGSVSLELLYHEKPTVILYWIEWAPYVVQSLGRTVQYITLVNLFTCDDLFPRKISPFDPDAPGAESVPFPEYLTYEDKSGQIASHIIDWLSEENELQRRIALLRTLKEAHARTGASARAAEYILGALRKGGSRIPAPHFATEGHRLVVPEKD
ncbi:MAG: lipid-A-disaccharide synthase [Planctomycetaceae bacterium]|nr:lipid-A-disaccharide synthase [Planctomycetaceae bacterium]